MRPRRGCVRSSTVRAPARRRSTSTPSTTRRRTSGTSCSGDWAATIPTCSWAAWSRPTGRIRTPTSTTWWPGRRPTSHVPLRIRLVKGAYWDHEEIVANAAGLAVAGVRAEGRDRRQLRALHEFLIDHAGEVRPAFAQPQPAQPRLRRSRTPSGASSVPARLELQLLYGMAEPVHAALVRDGPPRAGVRAGRRAGPGHGLPRAPPAREHVQRELRPPPLRRRPRPRRADPRAGRRRASTRRAAGRAAPARDRPGRAGAVHQRAGRRAPPGRGARRARRRASVTPRTGSGSSRPSVIDGQRGRDRPTRSSRSILVRFDRVVCRSGCADRPIADAAVDVAACRMAGVACELRGRSEPRPVPGGGDPARRDGPSWRRWRCSRPASRSPRPTPTCARRSTSASTTDARHSASSGGARGRTGPRRSQHVLLPAARHRCGDLAVELPARDPHRHGHRRARHRQRGDVQARRADARHRAAAGRGPPRGRRAAGRARVPARRRRGGRRRASSSTRDVAFIAFTGSKAVGLQIIERGGDGPTRAAPGQAGHRRDGRQEPGRRRRRRRPRRRGPGDRALARSATRARSARPRPA